MRNSAPVKVVEEWPLGVLAFYVCGHMFCYFDVDRFSTVSLKCRPEDIDDLKERHPEVGPPYNLSDKHWIGVDATVLYVFHIAMEIHF